MEWLINSNSSFAGVQRGYLGTENANVLLKELITTLNWESRDLNMYGKIVPQPRLIYACGEEGIVHKYSGLKIPLQPWVPQIKDIMDHFMGIFNANNYFQTTYGVPLEFNSCLLNYYRDHNDSIYWHNDKEVHAPLFAVVTVSLGASREFLFRPIGSNSIKDQFGTILHNGDLVIMYGTTQQQYMHSIPKIKNGECGPRISLTYRLFK